MTRYEWVKNMSVDEMAKFFDKQCSCSVCSRRNSEESCDSILDCSPYIRKWLEGEAESQ